MGAPADLTGKRFSRLLVVKKTHDTSPTNGRVWVKWFCRCDCGQSCYPRTSALLSGMTSSCGCLNRENLKAKGITHGMSNTPTYTSYHAMVKRCNNPNDPAYPNYGGRGVTVCDRWLERFENFLEDMGNRPKDTSIDRINNEKGYSKENCRWSNRTEQQNNTRSNRKISYKGRDYSVKEVSEKTGIGISSIRSRIQLGWTDEEIITIPFLGRGGIKNRAKEGGKKF